MGNADLSAFYVSKTVESALGTAQTATYAKYLVKSTLHPAHADEVDDMVNGYPIPSLTTRTARKVAGTISGPATAHLLSWALRHLFMAAATDGGTTGAYTHQWVDKFGTTSNVTPSSFTACGQFAKIASYIYQLEGLIVKSVTISQSGSGKVQVSVDIEGIGDVTATTDPAAALVAEGYFLARKTVLTVGGTTLSTALSSCSLKLTNGMAILDRAGSSDGAGTAIDRTDRASVELDYTIDEGVAAAYGSIADYEAKTARAVVLTFNGDSNRSLVVTIAATQQVSEYPLEVGPHGVYTVARKVIGVLDGSNNYLTTVTTDSLATWA